MIHTVPLYLPNAALLKQREMRTGVRIREDRERESPPGSLTAALSKQWRKFWQEKLDKTRAKMAGQVWREAGAVLRVTRRAISGVKCAPQSTPGMSETRRDDYQSI